MSYTLEIAKITDPVKAYEWTLYHHGTVVSEGVTPWAGKPQKVRALILRACRRNVPYGANIQVQAID